VLPDPSLPDTALRFGYRLADNASPVGMVREKFTLIRRYPTGTMSRAAARASRVTAVDAMTLRFSA
jgi:hypothetical protein